MQPVQQRARVRHVAAHRRVGPLAGAVAVEAQVQEHQLRHLVDHDLRVAQVAQPPARQLRPDDLVVVEADPAVRLLAPGRGLADVVQQRREPQHEVGDRRSRGPSPARARRASACRRPCAAWCSSIASAHRRDLRQHVLASPVSTSSSTRAAGAGPSTACQLDLHPLLRDRSPARPAIAVMAATTSRCRGSKAELGDEPGRPQHPQRIVGEGSSGVAGVSSVPAASAARPPCGSTNAGRGRSARRPSR